MISTCSPGGYFFHGRFSEQRHIFAFFYLLSVNNSLAKDLRPFPRPQQLCLQAAQCLQSGKVQLQQLSKKATPKPSLLPQIPSLPTARRKHPKHFAQGFMAVLLLLFLNQGGKDLEVFINKGCMKTSLFIQSTVQSDNCTSFI